VAVEQTAGRGSRGRGWSSPKGGLWLSVVSRPATGPALEVLSLRVALAAAAALEAAAVPDVRIKWPNDLMLGGRKLGGILCEARWIGDRLGWIVIGLGLNVRNDVPPPLRSLAVSLAEVGIGLRAGDLATPMIEALRTAGTGMGALDSAERQAFASRDWLAGRALAAPLTGTADGVTEAGILRIRGAGDIVHFARTGPVVLAGPSTFHV